MITEPRSTSGSTRHTGLLTLGFVAAVLASFAAGAVSFRTDGSSSTGSDLPSVSQSIPEKPSTGTVGFTEQEYAAMQRELADAFATADAIAMEASLPPVASKDAPGATPPFPLPLSPEEVGIEHEFYMQGYVGP